ncbi:lysozyme [Stenotrophomonas sp. NPDC078853]|uniref:lysozyme n=1 Tax=Stenotrophomonas sp. NPDC078853 TaxID=3364534 RepID=UPI00384E75ED
MKGKIAALAVVLLATPVVMTYEGVVQQRYNDPVGIPTACVGETDKEVVGFKAQFSREECVSIMGASLYAHALQLDKCISRPVSRQEAAAVLSWGYNVGTSAACGSTLVRLLNEGKPFCQELSRWTYAGGRQLPGLVRRRASERALCEGKS